MKILIALSVLFITACSRTNSLTPSPYNAAIENSDQSNVTTTTYDPYHQERLEMVQNDIEAMGIADQDVLEAMRSVPRHEFVPPEYEDIAYSDRPLPIGYGQTISQPYIVARMTELLELSPGDKVLEIGTGSGYQAAVLFELGDVDVFSVEIVPELAENAKERLSELGYEEIHLMQGDGYFGWLDNSPFDAIIVTAAPDHLPQPLVHQLSRGGRIVIPIGPQGGVQTLWVFERSNGDLTAMNMGLVRFVPFTGGGVDSGYPAP